MEQCNLGMGRFLDGVSNLMSFYHYFINKAKMLSEIFYSFWLLFWLEETQQQPFLLEEFIV